jgi:DnaD/phage-associated family protein
VSGEREGFPDGARWTPVPDLFMARDLPQMADPVTLKAALHLLWRIHRRERGAAPAISRAEVLADPLLRQGVARLGVGEAEMDARIEASLDELLASGVFIEARLAGADGPERWILVNGREGRAAHERLAAGDLLLPEPHPAAAGSGEARPNIYALYEANIGMLTPILAEELADAEATYPEAWIADAIRLAVTNGVHKWSYVRAILERWAREGRGDEGGERGQGDEIDRRGPEAHRGKDRGARYIDLIER